MRRAQELESTIHQKAALSPHRPGVSGHPRCLGPGLRGSPGEPRSSGTYLLL